jgi:hypothetical protein
MRRRRPVRSSGRSRGSIGEERRGEEMEETDERERSVDEPDEGI